MAFNRTIRIRYRSFLPGAGFSSSGKPKQGKTNVRGQVQIVDYVKGGTALTAGDMGLDTLDDVTLTLVDPVRNQTSISRLRTVAYSSSAGEFYVFENIPDYHQFYLAGGSSVEDDNNASNFVSAGELREIAVDSDFTLSFDAFGDSAHDIELT